MEIWGSSLLSILDVLWFCFSIGDEDIELRPEEQPHPASGTGCFLHPKATLNSPRAEQGLNVALKYPISYGCWLVIL
jgi:hypothetical protein